MSGFQETIKELVVLSELIWNQNFRACFIKHFMERVKELESVSSKIDVKVCERLQLKLLDPLLFHVKISSSSNDKCLLIQCIIQVLKITVIHNVNAFFDVYTVIFFQIFKGGNLSCLPSEELKECVLECSCILIKNSAQSVLEKVYTQDFGAKFSLGIHISVTIVKEERSTKLRIAALNFLLVSSKFENQFTYSEGIFNKIGNLFMLYLPGILAPLLEVILRNETQHHLITTNALTCWGHILCVVMKDSDQQETLSDSEIVQQWLVSQKESQEDKVIDVSEGLKEKKRTKLWLKSASEALHPLIAKLSDVRKHSHPKCRLELVLVMVKLLKNCIRNLKICLPLIIEVLVSSMADEDKEVSQAAEKALNELDVKSDTAFVPVLEENLYSVINRLPRILQSGNEQSLLLSLKSLSGYLRILGGHGRLQHLISLSSTLKKLVSVIKITFEFEVYPEISTQDISIWDEEIDSLWCKQWKRFRHFSSESVKTKLEEICRHLGSFGHSGALFDFLLETHEECVSFRKEILQIISGVLLGSNKIEDHVLRHLLDFYLKPENLSLPLQVNGNDCTNIKDAQANIICVALAMEGIGNLAKKMGEKFQEYLLRSLYYVLQRMGSNFSIIRQTATNSAVDIANACGLRGNVKFLIQNNMDYLTYHVAVKLKRNDESVLDVIAVLIKNSTLEAVPELEEIVNSYLKILSEGMARNYTSQIQIRGKSLTQFTLCTIHVTSNLIRFCTLRKWIKIEVRASHVQPETHVDQLTKYLNSLSEEETESEVEEEEMKRNELLETSDYEADKRKLPKHLKLILAVANHCLHYLASRDKDKKVMVLEILNECVWALADWEDDLLPLVHNIWSPLITKFETVADPLIINRSFTLLCTLSFTSRDFVRARTLKNVLPVLECFLIKQAAKSKLKDSASGYFFTQNFKLQRELLNYMGKLTLSLGLFEKQTDLVVESALPYLSSLQPRELQEKCQILFEDLKSYDEQLVRYRVHSLLGYSEFTKNAETVLDSVK